VEGLKKIDEKYMLITEEVRSKEEAIGQKMKLLHPKLFGIRLAKYELNQARKVYIPCQFMVFHYEIQRKIGLRREGKLAIIFDLNEIHPYHFDLNEEQLRTIKIGADKTEGIILPDKCLENEVERKSVEMIQWKILFRFYKSTGDVRLYKKQKFYRPAWELDLTSNNRSYVKYASLDPYGHQSEQISGLKVRLES
jgi:hypothetical protein